MHTHSCTHTHTHMHTHTHTHAHTHTQSAPYSTKVCGRMDVMITLPNPIFSHTHTQLPILQEFVGDGRHDYFTHTTHTITYMILMTEVQLINDAHSHSIRSNSELKKLKFTYMNPHARRWEFPYEMQHLPSKIYVGSGFKCTLQHVSNIHLTLAVTGTCIEVLHKFTHTHTHLWFCRCDLH